jgi:hypothetical protein
MKDINEYTKIKIGNTGNTGKVKILEKNLLD